MSAVEWKCPKCGSVPERHGWLADRCASPSVGGSCIGFLCECDSEEEGHGDGPKTACDNAHCYHCGWQGTFPTKAHAKKQNLVPCAHCKGTGVVESEKEAKS